MQRRNRWYQQDHKQLEEMGIIYQITLCDFSVLQLLEINHWLPILIQTYSFWRKRNPYAFSSTIYLSVPSNQQYWCICHSHALCMTKQLTFLSYLQVFFLYYHEWSSNWISNTNETHTISLSVTLNLTLFLFLNYGMHETEKICALFLQTSNIYYLSFYLLHYFSLKSYFGSLILLTVDRKERKHDAKISKILIAFFWYHDVQTKMLYNTTFASRPYINALTKTHHMIR